MRVAQTLLIILVFCAGVTTPFVASAATTTMFASVEPSLAIVMSADGKHIHTGTAFCIGSHDNTAYFLTNHHVIGNDTYPRIMLAHSTGGSVFSYSIPTIGLPMVIEAREVGA